MGSDAVRNLFLFAPPFILSLSIHEWAHAWSAFKLGDPTAKLSGRLTVDPLAHISWIGTVLFPALAILRIIPFFFGWAKPVPVDTRYFKNPRAGMAIVAAAGPAVNVILAIVLAIIFGQLGKFYVAGGEVGHGLLHSGLEMIQAAIFINISLAVFNMIPIPPLDGSRILVGILPRKWAYSFEKFSNSEIIFWLLIPLAFSGAFGFLIVPIRIIYGILQNLFM